MYKVINMYKDISVWSKNILQYGPQASGPTIDSGDIIERKAGRMGRGGGVKMGG